MIQQEGVPMSNHIQYYCPFCGQPLGTNWPDKHRCKNPNCRLPGIIFRIKNETRRHKSINFMISNRLIRQRGERPTSPDTDMSGSSASFFISGNSLAPRIGLEIHCIFCGDIMHLMEDYDCTTYVCNNPHHRHSKAVLTHSYAADGCHNFKLHY